MKYEDAAKKCMDNEHFLIKVGEDIKWCAFCGSVEIKGRVKVPDTYIEMHKLRNFAARTRVV